MDRGEIPLFEGIGRRTWRFDKANISDCTGYSNLILPCRYLLTAIESWNDKASSGLLNPMGSVFISIISGKVGVFQFLQHCRQRVHGQMGGVQGGGRQAIQGAYQFFPLQLAHLTQ